MPAQKPPIRARHKGPQVYRDSIGDINPARRRRLSHSRSGQAILTGLEVAQVDLVLRRDASIAVDWRIVPAGYRPDS